VKISNFSLNTLSYLLIVFLCNDKRFAPCVAGTLATQYSIMFFTFCFEIVLYDESISVHHYFRFLVTSHRYFRRTHTQQEIDLIADYERILHCYEMKRGKKKTTLPSVFASSYPDHTYQIVNPETIWDLVRM